MADVSRLGAIAAQVVKRGISARQGAAIARQSGLRFTDANWYKVVGEVRRSLTNQVDEATRPLGRRPVGDQISSITSKVARGYMQYVSIIVRDKQTGAPIAKPWAIRTHSLLTRSAAIARAVSQAQAGAADNPENYPEEIIGAVYTATYEFIPEG